MSIIYKDDNVRVEAIGSDFFITYDAGAHQIEMRRDNITAAEAQHIAADPAAINTILIDLQKRLTASGINPYKSNM